MGSFISPTLMDAGQLLVWLAAVLVGFFGIRRGLEETRQNRLERVQEREHRQRELRWQKAKLAREALRDLFGNRKARDAMQMMDWSGRSYEVAPNSFETVSSDEFRSALRIINLGFSDKEQYVRDCFDELLDGFELIEHYLRTGLVKFEDVHFPLEYHVKKLKKFGDAVSPFIQEYEFFYAADLVGRFS